MTNLEAIRTAVRFPIPISSDQYELVATRFNLVLANEYTIADQGKVYASAAVLLTEGGAMLNSFSEGGMSVSFNTSEINKYIAYLAGLSGGLFVIPANADRQVRNIPR